MMGCRSYVVVRLLVICGLLSACGGDASPSAGDGAVDTDGSIGGKVDGGPTSSSGRKDGGTPDPDTGGRDGAVDPGASGDGGSADPGPSVMIDDNGDRVFLPGKMPLSDYIECTESSDCFDGNGSCIKSVKLNRSEATANGSRIEVPVSELAGFESVVAGRGVCSVSCTESQAACPRRFVLGARVDPTPWTCQVVYVGDSPYERTGGLPLLPLPDDAEMTAGVPFAALCRPPFERTTHFAPDFCAPCSTAQGENCSDGSSCVADAPFSGDGRESRRGHCSPTCADEGDCPTGFACRKPSGKDEAVAGASKGKFCFPLAGSCGSCVDRDGDGRGEGACAEGTASSVDCDDAAELTYYDADHMDHAFPLSCGPEVDGNCDGLADDSEQIGVTGEDGTLLYGAYHCGACRSTCTGTFGDGEAEAPATCLPGGAPGGTADSCGPDCDTTVRADCNGDPQDGCELLVTDRGHQYVADCDGDGHASASAAPRFDCGAGLTVSCHGDCGTAADDPTCQMVLSLPTGEYGDDCNDDPDNGGSTAYPGAPERCDLVDDSADNDCDGTPDNAELSIGASCASSGVGACGAYAAYSCDADGSRMCSDALATAEICNGVDDDCDGVIDNGATQGLAPNGSPASAGQACVVPGAVGACATGTTGCENGLIVCVPAASTLTDLPGDDLDSNCDGFDGNLSRAVFIASNGSLSPDGSRGRPFQNFADAFADLARTGRAVSQIYVATGTYTVPRALDITGNDPGFSIVGGYAFSPPSGSPPSPDGTWSATPGSTPSVLQFEQKLGSQSAKESTLCGAGLSAAECAAYVEPRGFKTAISVFDPLDVLLKQITIRVKTPPAGFGNVVGLLCEANAMGALAGRTCANMRLDGVTVDMVGGAPGLSGSVSPALDGENGGLPDAQLGLSVRTLNGTHYMAACGATSFDSLCGTYSALGNVGVPASIGATTNQGPLYTFDQSLGMTATAVGIRPGTTSTCASEGGFGGGFYSTGYVTYLASALDGSLPGDAGQNGLQAGQSSRGGDAGTLQVVAPPTALQSTPAMLGKPGHSAIAPGAAGVGGESLSPLVMGAATRGQPGTYGGGGGGSATMLLTAPGGNDYIQPGAGGAAGGCGGGDGPAGGPGGSIIGVYYNDATEPNISPTGRLKITMGKAGDGGDGGKGGKGGDGGSPGTQNSGEASWVGGAGGAGSGGGGGGGGAGGWSIAMAIYQGGRSYTPVNMDIVAVGSPGQAGAVGPGGDPGISSSNGVDELSRGATGLGATLANNGDGLAENFCLLDTIDMPQPRPQYFSCSLECAPGYHTNGAGDGCDPDKIVCAAADGQGGSLGTGYRYWSVASDAFGPCLGPCKGGFVASGQACSDANVVCASGSHWDIDQCVSDA